MSQENAKPPQPASPSPTPVPTQSPQPSPAVKRASAATTPKSSTTLALKLGAALVILIVVACIGYYGGYRYGFSSYHSTAAVAASANLQVPNGATIIEECAPKRGTQYILPEDIPHGPVFGVYNGKVTGLEYMIGKQELANNVTFQDLPLYDEEYNHLDIGLVSQGHAGFPVPHYHVDVHANSTAASAAITCK